MALEDKTNIVTTEQWVAIVHDATQHRDYRVVLKKYGCDKWHIKPQVQYKQAQVIYDVDVRLTSTTWITLEDRQTVEALMQSLELDSGDTSLAVARDQSRFPLAHVGFLRQRQLEHNGLCCWSTDAAHDDTSIDCHLPQEMSQCIRSTKSPDWQSA